jgi:cytochrome P450
LTALPQHPIAAVTHADPYPYYAHLVAHKPVYRDETLGLWVASSAEAVTAVFNSDLCRVRPPAEPVPRALLGSPAAEIFRHLVRMNDGPGHDSLKPAVSRALEAIDADRAAEQSATWARLLADESDRKDFAFHLPVYVMGSLLGVPRAMLHQTALWTGDFVGCLAPASSSERIERGKVAAGHLVDLFRPLLEGRQTGPASGLLGVLEGDARRAGCGDTDRILANGIGLLSQAYEATAGLIGNTLLALASRPDVRRQVTADPGLFRNVVQEVLRYDPPIQNTRRFLARSGTVAGHEMKEGDGVLVVLAAANRDPSANANPDRFDIFRVDRRSFTFGAGPHACPGEALATTIAVAGVAALMRSGTDLERLPETMTYRPSANARIPLFGKL